MKIRFCEKNRINFIYYCALAIYILQGALSASMLGQNEIIDKAYPYVMFVCLLLCGVKIVYTKGYQFKTLFSIFFVAILVLGIYYKVNIVQPMMLAILIIASKDCSDRIISKVFLVCTGTIVFISMVCSQTGIIVDRLFPRGVDDLSRHSMGMTYVTMWSAMIFFLMAAYIYLRGEKISKIELILMVPFAFWCYWMSGTRTEIVASLALLLVVFFYKWIKRNKVFLFCIKHALLISVLLTFVMQGLYMANPDKYQILNSMLTDRLRLTSIGIRKYGFSLLGKIIPMQGNGTIDYDESIGYFFIDSFYFNFLLQYGVIYMAVFIAAFAAISIKLYKSNDIWLLVFLAFASFHGIIISVILAPYVCPFYFMAFAKSGLKQRRLRS